jgi:CRP-like cAMP-binding protein
MKVDQLEPFLRNCSCFAVLNDEQLKHIAEQAEFRHFKLGEVVFRQGDAGDKMYVVYSGKVRVLREDGDREIPLNTLFPGEHFGELALVHQAPRSATIRAAADSTLVAISDTAVSEFLANDDDIRKYFERYAERLALWNFIKVVGQIGRDLKPPQLRKLVDRFEDQRFEANGPIVEEGRAPDAFYVVHTGRVKVLRDSKVYATLTAGDTFGGGSLLESPPRPSPWTVLADGPVEVLKLDASEFQQLLHDAPTLRRFFEEQAAVARADEADGHFRELSLPGARPDATVEELPSALESAGFEAAEEPAAEAAAAPVPESTTRPAAVRRSWPARFWNRFRFPFIAQHEVIDCGAACLGLVSAQYGRPNGVSRVR